MSAGAPFKGTDAPVPTKIQTPRSPSTASSGRCPLRRLCLDFRCQVTPSTSKTR